MSGQDLAGPLIILVAVFLVFGRAISFGFTNWDDNVNVTENPTLQPVTLRSIAWLWSNTYHHFYIPVVYTTYAIELLLAGGSPWIFHFTNLVLHSGSAICVYYLLRRLLEHIASRDSSTLATIGALLFAIHPLQVEPVCWITGRKDVLSGFLSLLSCVLYLRSSDVRSRTCYVGAIIAYCLALLSKPSILTLPALLFIMDWFILKATPAVSMRRLLPWWIATLIAGIATLFGQPVPEYFASKILVWQRPLIAADSFIWYCIKAVAPAGLGPVYGRYPWVVAAQQLNWAKALCLVLALVAAFRWRTVWSAAFLLFLLPLLPVLGFMPFLYQNYSTVADRYAYISLAGLSLAGCFALGRVPSFRIRVLITAVITLLFGMLSFRQTGVWRSSIEVWQRAIAVGPHVAESHLNLASAYDKAGREPEDLHHFIKAAELNPEMGETHNSLGVEHLDHGRLSDAEKHFQMAVAAHEKAGYHDRRMLEALVNLGVAHMRLNQLTEAEARFLEARRLDPMEWAPHTNLGLVYEKSARIDDAAKSFSEALRLNPNDRVSQERLAAIRQR